MSTRSELFKLHRDRHKARRLKRAHRRHNAKKARRSR